MATSDAERVATITVASIASTTAKFSNSILKSY